MYNFFYYMRIRSYSSIRKYLSIYFIMDNDNSTILFK